MASNILEEVQEFVARKLNADSELSACVTFLAENKKDIDFEIKNALGKQGIVGCVLTPKATYQGKYEDLFLAWQLDELEIDVVENPIVNRGRKNGYMTGQDAAMKVFQVLCPLAGEDEGQFNPVSYEEGEDNGLLVNKCVLKTLVYGEHQDEPGPEPELRMKFVKLLDEPPPEGVQPRDGWMWVDGDSAYVCSGERVIQLGMTEGQVSAYVESQVSSKADLSAVPTNVSQLSNDSGYVTSAQIVPSQVNAGNASASDKSLVSQALAEDAADEHSTRVVVDEYGNVILQKYTTGWYVSKIEEGTGSPLVYTETDAYYAFVSDIRIEPSEGRLYYTATCQDKQRNLPSKSREDFAASSASEFIAYSSWTSTQTGGQSISLRLTITNAETPVWVDVARLVPDSSKYSGLLDTQITPNGQFVTPAQVKPYTAIQGYASRAQGSLFMFGRSGAWTPDENHYVTIDYTAGKLCYVGLSYYPWHLSMYNGTTFDPPLEMVYGYRSTVGYKVNGRVRNIAVNSNCWLVTQTVDARNTRPLYIKAVEDDDGQMIPDNNLYIVTVAHPITFDEFKRSIETIDGVAGDISCTRESAGTYTTEFKYFPFEDDVSAALSAKADVSALADYYAKSETSSAAQLSTAFGGKQDALSEDQLFGVDQAKRSAQTKVGYQLFLQKTLDIQGQATSSDFDGLNSINKVEFGTGVTSIGKHALDQQPSLTAVDIPETVTVISSYGLARNGLSSVSLPQSLQMLGGYAFYKAPLSSVELPANVRTLGEGAFSGCSSMVDVKLNDGLDYISSYVFRNCRGLTRIEIPRSVSYIGYGTFMECYGLSAVVFRDRTLQEIQQMDQYPWAIGPSRLSVFQGAHEATTEWTEEMLSGKADSSTVQALAEQVSSKAALSAIPTKTSQLSNDSGFITSSALVVKRDLTDMKVKGVPQNDNNESWFSVSDGTTTENAFYYDEGRWESGQTFRVLAVPASIFSLQKTIEGQWTNIGEFQLDSDAQATITYGGVTYSITGYVGDLVASNQLPEIPRYVPVTIKQDRTLYPSSQTITVKTSPTKTLTVATNPNGNGGTFVANFMTSGWNDGAALSDVVTAPDTAGCLVFKTSGQSNDTWGNLKSTPVSDVESFDIAFPL